MTQIKDDNGNWVAVAGGQRTWVGTKAALQTALNNDEIPNGTPVMVTDDYDVGGPSPSKVYYLGYEKYGVGNTVTINTTGRHTMIVSPHTGSSNGYQAQGLSNVYAIEDQIRRSDLPTVYGTQAYENASSPAEFITRRVALFKVTAVTQDTVTITTNDSGIEDVGFAWLTIHVI